MSNIPTRKFYVHPFYSEVIDCYCAVGCDNHYLRIIEYNEPIEWDDNIKHTHVFEFVNGLNGFWRRAKESFKLIFQYDKFQQYYADGVYLNKIQMKSLHDLSTRYSDEEDIKMIDYDLAQSYYFLWDYGVLDIFITIGQDDSVILYKMKNDENLIVYPIIDKMGLRERLERGWDHIKGHKIYPFRNNEVLLTDNDMCKFRTILRKSLELIGEKNEA